jgi:pilus assembly protein CpaB
MKLSQGAKFFIFSGVAGMVAVFLAHSYINKKVSVPFKTTCQVVVANADIAPGTALSSQSLRLVTWPEDIVPSKAVTSLNNLNGRVALTVISKGEPILLSKLAPEGTEAGLGGLLASDRLAVSVKTDEVSGVAGFISPGDRVDVLADMQSSKEGSEHFSKLILQNLKVLSKGQTWDQTADKKPTVVQTVTLEVTAPQAEVLNLACFQGKIRLALRSQQNRANFCTEGVGVSQLCNNQSAAPAPMAAGRASKPKTTVQIIKGMDISHASFETAPERQPLQKRVLSREIARMP